MEFVESHWILFVRFVWFQVTDGNGRQKCLSCKRGYMVKTFTEGDLYKQLRYYHYMFDPPKYEESRKWLPAWTLDIFDSAGSSNFLSNFEI